MLSFNVDKRGIGILKIGKEDKSKKGLSPNLFVELGNLIGEIEGGDYIKAVIITGEKDEGFIPDIDLEEFLKFSSEDDGRLFSLRAQDVLNRIERCRVPFIAAINGLCTGVGFEVALACSYRMASDNPRVAFGFPAVNLGLIPFAGGTQRLPRLIGISRALDVFLTGRVIDTAEALRLGLVDEVVPEEILLSIALERALMVSGGRRSKSKRFGFTRRLLEKNSLVRKILFSRAKRNLVDKKHLRSLAPLMILESVEVGMSASFSRGLHVESVYFGELVVSDISRQLLRFFLSVDDIRREFAEQSGHIKPVKKIVVVGSNPLGSQFAIVAAEAGICVRLYDTDYKKIGEGLRNCYRYFKGKLESGAITEFDMRRRLNLISYTCDHTGFRNADLVVETFFKDLGQREEILKGIERVAGKDTVLILVTFSTPLSIISSVLPSWQGRVVGVRPFLPISNTGIVELIHQENSPNSAIGTVVDFLRRTGILPVFVRDKEGFFATRVLLAYLFEAFELLGEGAMVEQVDEAMIEFGFPKGPFALIDEIGLEFLNKVGKGLYESLGERFKMPLFLEKMAMEKNLEWEGFYNGEGKVNKSVYNLIEEKIVNDRLLESDFKVKERLCLRMLSEAISCLEEGIIRNPRDGDVVAVLGLGFPVFLGGPFRYADSLGLGIILEKLEALSHRFGSRFAPSGLLKELALERKRFYDA